MSHHRPLKPKDPLGPQKKKSHTGAIGFSVFAVLIIMFSLGKFPQVNQFFTDTNLAFQRHNDEVVSAILQNLPMGLILIGIVGLTFIFVRAMTRPRPSA